MAGVIAMATIVGTKGQIVVEKAIREQFGVKPGWQALQVVVEDHLRIYFLPPEHEDSLLGAARPFIRRYPAPDEVWDVAVAHDTSDAEA
jgi:bifunctional DNA-binding transcriptional regulator/antitoxin component of YhaV-PrlF toxin-antitoxin module